VTKSTVARLVGFTALFYLPVNPTSASGCQLIWLKLPNVVFFYWQKMPNFPRYHLR